MALIHVKNYYKQQSRQYKKMLDLATEIDKEYKEGLVTKEQVLKCQEQLVRAKQPFELLAEIMYLFKLPRRYTKSKQMDKVLGKSYAELSKYSPENVYLENEDVLKDVEEVLKKARGYNEKK